MNSPFANMYLEIMQRIKTEVPEIKYINQDIGQLENYGDRPPVTFPCILIDFEDFSFSDMGEASQIAEGVVKIRLAFAPFSNASNINNDAVQQKALLYYDLEWKVNKVLHAWEGETFGCLMRASASSEAREDNIRVRDIMYSTTFQDNSAGNNYDPLPENMILTIENQDQEVIVDGNPGIGQGGAGGAGGFGQQGNGG